MKYTFFLIQRTPYSHTFFKVFPKIECTLSFNSSEQKENVALSTERSCNTKMVSSSLHSQEQQVHYPTASILVRTYHALIAVYLFLYGYMNE
jgi:hypothetical protein